MKLIEAFNISVPINSGTAIIRVDRNGYICLTDMAEFFPGKRIDNWKNNDSTREFIDIVEKTIIPGKQGIINKRGKGGGTWAHDLVAFEFAMWLSPEFKLRVYLEYINGTQHKKNWNMQRQLAAFNHRIMTDAIKAKEEDAESSEYAKENMLINRAVFGIHRTGIRDLATEEELDLVAKLEGENGALIAYGLSFEKREEHILSRGKKLLNNKG